MQLYVCCMYDLCMRMYLCMFIWPYDSSLLTEEDYDDIFENLSKTSRSYELPVPVRLDEMVDILFEIWDSDSSFWGWSKIGKENSIIHASSCLYIECSIHSLLKYILMSSCHRYRHWWIMVQLNWSKCVPDLASVNNLVDSNYTMSLW